MSSLADRVGALGGRLDVSETPGCGTPVRARVPPTELGRATIPSVGKPHLGLVLHPDRAPGEAAERVVAWARSHGGEVLARPHDAARSPSGVEAVPDPEFVARADALVSLGGDGTMLGALRLAAASPIPVLGVNLGSLGFLVEIEPHELGDALDRLESGRFTIERHSAVVGRLGASEIVAFNDLVLARVPGEGVVQAELEVDRRRSGRYRCDAIVVSTPLGSTAYSYAAGGPVVSPALDAVVVAPVAPMAGISRPMVFSGQEPVTLTMLDGCRAALEVDGTIGGQCPAGTPIDIRLRPDAGLVVRLDSDLHQRRNQVKLSLLDLPFLPDEIRDITPAERLPAALRAT